MTQAYQLGDLGQLLTVDAVGNTDLIVAAAFANGWVQTVSQRNANTANTPG
jgi:hypothetical protein